MLNSFEKENHPRNQRKAPSRQSISFRIDLGLSQGPFPAQDIMHCNEKSTHLLAAK